MIFLRDYWDMACLQINFLLALHQCHYTNFMKEGKSKIWSEGHGITILFLIVREILPSQEDWEFRHQLLITICAGCYLIIGVI